MTAEGEKVEKEVEKVEKVTTDGKISPRGKYSRGYVSFLVEPMEDSDPIVVWIPLEIGDRDDLMEMKNGDVIWLTEHTPDSGINVVRTTMLRGSKESKKRIEIYYVGYYCTSYYLEVDVFAQIYEKMKEIAKVRPPNLTVKEKAARSDEK